MKKLNKRNLVTCAFALQAMILVTAFPVPAGQNMSTCNIHVGSCIHKTSDGMQVELDIQPKPVAAMRELTFIISLTKDGKPVREASSVLLDLSMPGMYMGKNQPVLKQAGDGRYEGKGTITRCMSGRKTWKAGVTIVRPNNTGTVDFVFEVK